VLKQSPHKFAQMSLFEVCIEQIDEQSFGCRANLTWIELDAPSPHD